MHADRIANTKNPSFAEIQQMAPATNVQRIPTPLTNLGLVWGDAFPPRTLDGVR